MDEFLPWLAKKYRQENFRWRNDQNNLKTIDEGKPKGFTQCLQYQLFQETNSQIIVPLFILKGKNSHESKANEGRDTQMATRVSESARVTTTSLVITSCKKDEICEC